MKPYQVTASIVVYKNDPVEVASAIRSVLSTPMRVKCTVVDNSPTPALRQYVTETGASYIYAGKNLGFGAAHNLALSSDCDLSDYHLVLNPDVYFSAGTPVALYHLMNDNRDVGMVMPKVLYPEGGNQPLCKQLPSPLDLLSRRFLGAFGRSLFANRLNRYELRHVDLSTACDVPCLSGCFMFIRSEVLREVGYFDERYFMYMEDVDLCRRIGARYKTVFYPKVAITHGYAKGSYQHLKLLRYHLQSAFKYFCKWGWISDSTRTRLNGRTSALILNESSVKAEYLPVSGCEHVTF